MPAARLNLGFIAAKVSVKLMPKAKPEDLLQHAEMANEISPIHSENSQIP